MSRYKADRALLASAGKKGDLMNPTTDLSPENKEQAQHGERMFPLKRYITTLSDLYPAVNAHWHDEAELTLITEGSCSYHIHLDTHDACEGDILFIPPAELHSINVKPGEKMCSRTYVFHMDFLGTSSTDICTLRYLTPIRRHTLLLPCIIKKDHPAYPQMAELFSQADKVYDEMPQGYEMILKALLLCAISALLPYREVENTRPQLEDEHTAKLKLVLEYIGEHYPEELSVPQLSKLCFFSEYHFMRFFKKYTGISCLEYIKNLRLEKAASRLAQGGQSVLDVSMSCGFSNLSYFYREFKKKYGMTPKKFIQEAPSLPFLPEQNSILKPPSTCYNKQEY